MHQWIFRNRFYPRALGRRVPQAVNKIRLAVAEIRKISTKNPVLAGDGAVLFLQKLSSALESSDVHVPALRRAVDEAIRANVKIIASARTNDKQRGYWLKKLLEALKNDQGIAIESLGDSWGELCATRKMASSWADRLLPQTKLSLSRNSGPDGYFHGVTACFSSLLAAGRHDELIDLVADQDYWPYRQWAVRALEASGKKDEALSYAENCLGDPAFEKDIKAACRRLRS